VPFAVSLGNTYSEDWAGYVAYAAAFVLVAGGYSAIMLAVFYFIVDVWQKRAWCQPFVWIGMNPITIYMMENLVDIIVGGDNVERGKPDPEPYLKALQRTGCDALASLAVEDSLTGARSAIAARIPTLLLGDVPTAVTLEAARIDHLDRVGEVLAARKSGTGVHP